MPSPRDVHPWVQQELIRIVHRLQEIEQITIGAGNMRFRPAHWPMENELFADGSVVLRETYPALFNAIGTHFNTGGELPTQFRLPNIGATAGGQWRISLGN